MLAFVGTGEACSPGFRGGWAACDQSYHLAMINYFIEHPWSILNYPDPWRVANLPGFHLLIALVARLFGYGSLGPDTWLRVIPFLFGLGTLLILWSTYRDLSGKPSYAGLLCLPILWSDFFYLPSLFLVTENQAYLGYAFLLMAYQSFPQRGLAIGLAATTMVSARQIFLPVVASHFLAFRGRVSLRSFDRSDIRAIAMGVLLPVAVVLVWVIAWHGLVPPDVIGYHSARALIELGPIVQTVGVMGVLAVPYGFLVYPALRGIGLRRMSVIVAFASVAALALWLLAATTRDPGSGRTYSFVWLLTRFSPAIGDHVVLVLPVLLLGFIAVGVLIEFALVRREFPIELVMFGFYAVALSMQFLSYQRYSEVVTLITLSATAARHDPPSVARAAAFAGSFAAKGALTIFLLR